MDNSKKNCRVCGKEYKICGSPRVGSFRWQDVACSPECGNEYIRRVIESRTNSTVSVAIEANDSGTQELAVLESTMPVDSVAEPVVVESPTVKRTRKRAEKETVEE